MNAIVKRIDKLGRVLLPADYRKALGLAVDDEVFLRIENRRITVSAAGNFCKLCGSDLEKDTDFPVCSVCIEKIRGR